MSVTDLQQRIRQKKTPLALGLRPELEKLSPKILKNFTDMFGPGSMGGGGSPALSRHHPAGRGGGDASRRDAPRRQLPALRHDGRGRAVQPHQRRPRQGSVRHSGYRCEEPALWQGYGADAITVDPYMGQRLLRCRRAGGVRPGAHLQQERW